MPFLGLDWHHMSKSVCIAKLQMSQKVGFAALLFFCLMVSSVSSLVSKFFDSCFCFGVNGLSGDGGDWRLWPGLDRHGGTTPRRVLWSSWEPKPHEMWWHVVLEPGFGGQLEVSFVSFFFCVGMVVLRSTSLAKNRSCYSIWAFLWSKT